MKINSKYSLIILVLGSCAPSYTPPSVIPSVEYANKIKREYTESEAARGTRTPIRPSYAQFKPDRVVQGEEAMAQLKLVSDEVPTANQAPSLAGDAAQSGAAAQPSYYEYRSQAPNTRDYSGPLALGDPGVTSSLWRETRSGSELFRDDRAWQPMDLITIVVSETAEGTKSANTETKQTSTIQAAISKLLGFENDATTRNSHLDPTALIDATTKNDFKGEGKTDRKDSLKARISAMVAEVLPSGILRIEGKRIIAVNSEEQIMVISGLARPRDINSGNEIDSSKLANLRIDYYGRGIIGEAQHGGWLGRIVRDVWPF